MKNPTLIYSLAGALIITVAPYLIIAFLSWQWNPASWGVWLRLAYVTTVVGLIVYFSTNRKNPA